MKMQNAHLAIASVPVQSWGEVYDQNEALKTGTVFKDLDEYSGATVPRFRKTEYRRSGRGYRY